jgi:error-prone DNA polymerase
VATPQYIELHCHSAYSFLDGVSLPQELAQRAGELGHVALALTDHNSLSGSMELAQAAADAGVRPIHGAEIDLERETRHRRGRGVVPLSPRGGHRGGHEDGCGDGTAHITLLVEEERGWRNLCRIITRAHARTRDGSSRRERGEPSVDLQTVLDHADGLVCLTGCAERSVLDRPPRAAEGDRLSTARRLLEAFGSRRLYVELQRPYARHDRARNRAFAQAARRLGVSCVATGDVHAHSRDRAELQDAFVALRHHTTLDACEPVRRGNHSHVMSTPQAMASRFADHPDAVRETLALAERLSFDLSRDLGYRYPGAEDETAARRLAELCHARLAERYPPSRGAFPSGGQAGEAGRAGSPAAASALHAEALARLQQELRVIERLGLAGFFLLHHDMLELARAVALEVRGPDSVRALLAPGRGRGSSVSSLVCYLTGLSHIDPIGNGLALGRFLHEDLRGLPDIDLDFPRDIRARLIPRVHERYGRERAALVAAFPTYRARGAIRELGKVLGLPAGEIERIARGAASSLEGDPRGAGAESVEAEDPADRSTGSSATRRRWLARLVEQAQGLPRHLSQHPGGMVIATRPLIDCCPVVPAAMEGRQMVQWDKDSCADAGFLKIDLLGLGMLSAVERCVEEIERVRGERIDLSRIPFDDQRTFSAIRAADTVGVFQIESRAQMQSLLRTRPRNLRDLTIQVAIVRPGPIQGGAINPYVQRSERLREECGRGGGGDGRGGGGDGRGGGGDGQEGEGDGQEGEGGGRDSRYKIPYEHPSLEPVLCETLGTIIFQDQVMEVAEAFAGFSAGEAAALRRAMSRKRSHEMIQGHRERFIEGAKRHVGADRQTAERVWGMVEGFAGYGFPKAHATAFGLLAYQSSWLRVHYGAEFLCALLNEQPMGFYAPDSLIHEAENRSDPVRVLGVDANASQVLCTVQDGAVRMGLGYIKGAGEAEMRALVAERERGGPFTNLGDLAARAVCARATLEQLAWSGACDTLCGGADRRVALWQLGVAASATGVLDGDPDGVGVAAQLALALELPAAPGLRKLDRWQRLIADYSTSGVTIGEHALAILRPRLQVPSGGDSAVLATSAQLSRLPGGSQVAVAGLVIARQRPGTAGGTMFLLFEDEFGTINLIVPKAVYERHRPLARAEPLLLARGRLERDRNQPVINVIVRELAALERFLPGGLDGQERGARVQALGGAREAEANERGQGVDGAEAGSTIRAVLPPMQSFAAGRRR